MNKNEVPKTPVHGDGGEDSLFREELLLSEKSILHQSFSVVEKIDNAIAVGYALGWDMSVCVNTLKKIIVVN